MKTFIWLGAFVGSTVGGMVPQLWGAGMFSSSGVILSVVGGLLGIWGGYRLARMF